MISLVSSCVTVMSLMIAVPKTSAEGREGSCHIKACFCGFFCRLCVDHTARMLIYWQGTSVGDVSIKVYFLIYYYHCASAVQTAIGVLVVIGMFHSF